MGAGTESRHDAPGEPRARRVVLADDGAWMRGLMAQDLADHGLEVLAETDDLPSTVRAIRDHEPDIAIIDLRMPPTLTNEGLLAAQQVRAGGLDTGIMLLSEHVDLAVASTLLETCGDRVGYLLKSRVAGTDELLSAIERIHDGGVVLEPTILVGLFRNRSRRNPLDPLTRTQLEVLRLVAEGYSNRGIAELQHISERTVESHVSKVFEILCLEPATELHRRVLATIVFLRNPRP